MSMTRKTHNLPAPRLARYRVEYVAGRGHMVVDPEGRRIGTPTTPDNARDRADRLQAEADRAAGRMERACLCCGDRFMSEGKGNRLCRFCRGRADPLDGSGYAGAGDGRQTRRLSRA